MSPTTVLAAGPTWGIPGSTFLAGYVAAVVVTSTAAGLLRRRVGPGPDGLPDPPLTPAEVAYLRQGPDRAVASSLGSLRVAGALDPDARPTAAATPAGPLDAAVLDALRQAGTAEGRKVPVIRARAGVHRALADLEAQLRDRGLLRTPAENARARSFALVPWALTALGLARILAGIAHHQPVGYLVVATIVTAVVAAGFSFPSLAGPNRAAGRAVAAVEREHLHLRPGQRPSWTTYGADGAGMAVALFGASALVTSERGFVLATAMDTPATSDNSSSDGSSGGGGCGG